MVVQDVCEGDSTGSSLPRSAGEARAVVAEVLREHAGRSGVTPASVVVEDVLLVVSELVTNAVRHGDGMTGFACEIDQGVVRVRVCDASERLPVLVSHPQGGFASGGYGWRLVGRLAKKVSVDVRAGVGKRVSAEIALC